VQHTRLGRTGPKVSCFCPGTMTLGGQCDEDQSRATLDALAAQFRSGDAAR
jgi:aryl-alcohol dehydrogenase-like predicted oxidoreductase